MKPKSRTKPMMDFMASKTKQSGRYFRKQDMAESVGLSNGGLTKILKAIETGRDFRVETEADGSTALWEKKRSPWRLVSRKKS